MSVYLDSEELAEHLSGRMPKAIEEIKAAAKGYIDSLLGRVSEIAQENLQRVRRCGIASKVLVSLILFLYIDGQNYEYRLGETTL